MAIRDEIRRERQAFFATATPKQKILYLIDYYKFHALVVIIVLSIVGYAVYHAVTDPEIVLNGLMTNVYTYNQPDHPTALGREFLEAEGIDTSEYDISFGSNITLFEEDSADNYQGSQAMMVQAAAGTLDFVTGPAYILTSYAYGGMFADLTTLLSEDEIKAYEPYFYYIDGAVLKQLEAAEDEMNPTSHIAIPDSTKPEEMKEPIPIFIDMTKCEKLVKAYATDLKQLCFGVVVNAPHKDMALKFMNYLMK